MRVYVVQVMLHQPASYDAKVSQEGYASLEKAQAFIESRAGSPTQVSPYWYRSIKSATDYLIYEVNIV